MDDVGFLGMKGLIDLRVANILAKQAALQHKAAIFQSRVAQLEADNAAWYTARADKLEEAYNNQSYDPEDPAKSAPPPFVPPHSSNMYSTWDTSVLSKGRDDSSIINPHARPLLASFDATTLSILVFRTARSPHYANFI